MENLLNCLGEKWQFPHIIHFSRMKSFTSDQFIKTRYKQYSEENSSHVKTFTEVFNTKSWPCTHILESGLGSVPDG